MDMRETQISGEYFFEGRIMKARVDEVRLPNGKQASREVCEHVGGVGVLPIDRDGNIILVRQFRYPFAAVTTEVPAGKLEKGEDHAACGRRELLEEVGCECSEFIYLGEMLPTPAYDTEITHMYLAKGLSFSCQSLDEDEFLDVEKIPLAEAVKLVMDGKIRDGKTQLAILKAARILGI